MSKPDMAFPRYWYYYIVLTILLIVAAVALKLYSIWE
jgi:hypothetical protein